MINRGLGLWVALAIALTLAACGSNASYTSNAAGTSDLSIVRVTASSSTTVSPTTTAAIATSQQSDRQTSQPSAPVTLTATTTEVSASTSTASSSPPADTSTTSEEASSEPATYDGASIPIVGHADTRPDIYWPCRVSYSRQNCKMTSGSTRVVMVGDSFTARLFPTIYELALENDWELHYLVVEGCPWPVSVSRTNNGDCTDLKHKVVETIDKVKPSVTIYTSFPYEKHGESARQSGQWPESLQAFSDVVSVETGQALTEPEYISATIDAAQWTRDTTGGEVIIIEPAPIISRFDGLACARAATTPDSCDFSMVNHNTVAQQNVWAYAVATDRVHYVSFNHWFCDGANCGGVYGGHSLLEDDIHFNSQIYLAEKGRILQTLQETGAGL